MATLDQPVRIDAGTSVDLDAVMEVMDSAFGDEFGEAWTRSQLSGILPMSGVELRVAKDSASDAMLGFSLTRTVADESELLLLAVDRDNQRNGVGRRLLEDFVNNARRERAARVHLEVRDGNPAISMYRAAGFLPVGRRRNYYQGASGNRFDAVTLALLL
jgi:ribosomal-protein-alanine N-acetyltransferase